MPERRQLEFFVLRYVPDVVKGEFMNIGVVMVEKPPDGFPTAAASFADVRFARDWRRVRCLDPQVDVEMLEAMENEIRKLLETTHERTTLLRKMEDSFSSVIQLSPVERCWAEDPVRELKSTSSIYLDNPKLLGRRDISGRQKILEEMRDAFEQAGVLGLLSPVAAAPYTRAGDPLQFDFGYRVGGKIKLFHAISLKASVETAVTLAARYPRIVPVMSVKAGGVPVLTAVIDDGLDYGQDNVKFALSMMQDEKIRIAVAADMPQIAEVAKQELRA